MKKALDILQDAAGASCVLAAGLLGFTVCILPTLLGGIAGDVMALIMLTMALSFADVCCTIRLRPASMKRRANNMQNCIQIEVRNVYGSLKIYPICGIAKTFADIAGSKTLTCSTVKKIESLGYAIQSSACTDWTQAA